MAAARKKRAAKKKAPTKRTPEVEEAITRSLRVGVARTSAAAIAGIGRQTLVDWLNGDAVFRTSCEKAEGEARARVAAKLFRKATDGDVTCMIWWQKCRDSEFLEPKEQPVHVDVGDRTGHALICHVLEELGRQVAQGRIPASALEYVARAMGRESDVLERSDLEERIVRLESAG